MISLKRSRSIFVSLLLVLTTGVAALTFSRDALAADPAADKALAKEAYDRGLEAHKRGDLHKAAEEFARADALAPSAVALQAALDAAIEADDAPLGAELLERSKREPATPALASSITAAHVKFSGRAGRIRVLCPPKARCLAKLDDKPVEMDKVVWTNAGQRTVIVQVDGEAQTKLVEVTPDQIVDVSPTNKKGAVATPPPPYDPAAASAASNAGQHPAESNDASKDKRGILEKGFPPIIFYAGVGATVLLGAGTAYFALTTASDHDKFTGAGCEKANFADCEDLKSKGEEDQNVTNILIIGTAVVGLGTAVIGAALTNWKGPLIAVHPGGGEAVWRVVF